MFRRFSFHIFLMFVVYSPLSVRAQECEGDTQPGTQPVQTSSKKLLTGTFNSITTSDMGEFCSQEVFKGVGNLTKGWTPEFALKVENNPAQYLDQFGSGWNASTFPSLPTAEVTFNSFSATAQNGVQLWKSPKEAIAYLNTKPNLPSDEQYSQIRSNILKWETMPIGQGVTPVDMSGFAKNAICAELTVMSNSSCAKGLDEIPAVLDAKEVYLFLPLFKRLLTSPTLQEGLRKAALKIAGKAKSSANPNGNLFDDLKSSFVESGMSVQAADDSAWDILGVISTSGPNICQRLEALTHGALDKQTGFDGPNLNLPVVTSISLIASAVPLLDVRSSQTGHMYSYPQNVHASCNNGKYYHFWMSAYLARELRKRGLDRTGSAAAVFTAQKGYQMLAMTGSRKPTRAFSVPSYDSFNNVMRMDLAFSAAGAFFGAESYDGTVTRNLDVDQTIRTLVQSAGDSEVRSTEAAQELLYKHPIYAYQVWSEIFSPNTAFRDLNP